MGSFDTWAEKESNYKNECQSCFSGMHLIFEMFWERGFKEMLAVAYLVFLTRCR